MPLLTAKHLNELNRTIPETFSFRLTHSIFDCCKILRLLPQRRMVCLAKKNGTQSSIIIKLFIHSKKAKTDYQKEIQGYDLLSQSELSLPKRQQHGLWEATNYFIIYDYIECSKPLSQALSEAHNSNSLIQQMLKSVSIMHDSNLQQIDLHLDNFLLQGSQLFSLDFAEIRPLNNLQSQLQNLALLLSQFPIVYDQKIAERLDYYNRQLNNTPPILFNQLTVAINQCRQYRIKKYLQKVARNCSEFIKFKSFNQFHVIRREYQDKKWQAIFADPDQLIKSGQILKDGNTATVARIILNKKQLVIKRYNIKNFSHFLSRCWRPSRAWTSWKNAHRLNVLGIGTPKPIAVIEKRFGWLRLKAYYITEYNSAPDSLTIYKNNQGFNPQQLGAFKALFTSLSDAQITHGDMKGSNLLLENEQVSLIDLDAMKQHSREKSFNRAQQKDLCRFFQNWQDDEQLNTQFNKLFKQSDSFLN